MKKLCKGPVPLTAVTAPGPPLHSCCDSDDILFNMSVKTTLVMFISALFMVVKQLGNRPDVNMGRFLQENMVPYTIEKFASIKNNMKEEH